MTSSKFILCKYEIMCTTTANAYSTYMYRYICINAYTQYHVSGNFDERKVFILADHFDMHTIAIRCTVHVANGCI